MSERAAAGEGEGQAAGSRPDDRPEIELLSPDIDVEFPVDGPDGQPAVQSPAVEVHRQLGEGDPAGLPFEPAGDFLGGLAIAADLRARERSGEFLDPGLGNHAEVAGDPARDRYRDLEDGQDRGQLALAVLDVQLERAAVDTDPDESPERGIFDVEAAVEPSRREEGVGHDVGGVEPVEAAGGQRGLDRDGRGRGPAAEADIGVSPASDLAERKLLLEDDGQELPRALDVRDLAPDPGVHLTFEVDRRVGVKAAEARFETARPDVEAVGREVDPDLDPAAEGERISLPFEKIVLEFRVGRKPPMLDAERRDDRGADGPGDGKLAEDGIRIDRGGPAFDPAAPEGQDQAFGGPARLEEARFDPPPRLREELKAAPEPAHGHPRDGQIVGADAGRPAVLALEAALAARAAPIVEGDPQDRIHDLHVDIESGVELDRRIGEVPDAARGVDRQARAVDGQPLDGDILALPRKQDGQASERVWGPLRRGVRARRRRGPEGKGFAGLGDQGPDAPHVERRLPRLEYESAVLDEPPLDDERDMEVVDSILRIPFHYRGRAGGEGRLERKDGRGVGKRAEVLDDEGRGKVRDRQTLVGVSPPDPLADLVEQGRLADDEDDGDDGQDEERHGGPADLQDEGPDHLADPEDRVKPHVFTFLQSARRRLAA